MNADNASPAPGAEGDQLATSQERRVYRGAKTLLAFPKCGRFEWILPWPTQREDNIWIAQAEINANIECAN